MEQFFIDADKDDSGQLSLHELAQALRNAGYRGSDEEILVITWLLNCIHIEN